MNTAPKVAISDDFLKSFARVQRGEQAAVLRFLAKFRNEPRGNGINYERIRDAADAGMRSVRINDDLRCIVLHPPYGDVYCLLWVDRHDAAYTWARRHRVAIHPDLGSVQVFGVENGPEVSAGTPGEAPASDRAAVSKEAAEPAAPQHETPAQASAAPLFQDLSDAQVRRLGVPDEKLALVRAVDSEAQLDALQSQLPAEAHEALYLFAIGESFENLVAAQDVPETVDTNDFGTALERTQSRRHFLVLTEDSDLEALLAAPLELWRVFLHPSQRKLVERHWNGPVKVTGGAGTGKTVVAMHRARYLANLYKDVPGQPVVFTTFTRTLAEDIRRNLKLLCTPQELDKIQVVNLDKWAADIVRGFGYRHQPLYDDEKRKRYWSQALGEMPDSLELTAEFVRAEFERVVLAQSCESVEEYLRASRVGRGGQLSRRERKELWPVFAEYRALLRTDNLREPEEIYRDALLLLETRGSGLGILSMVVDEAQDISQAAFKLIRAAVPEGQGNDLFIVGDAHQRIYRHKVVLSQAGINVRGRSRRLRVNYRTTDEIRRWACAALEGCAIDDLDGETETLNGYRSLTHGEAPELLSPGGLEGEIQSIRQALQDMEGSIPAEQVCIVARTNGELNRYEEALQKEGISFLRLGPETSDDQSVPGVRLATMHRIKGLEFTAVILAGYRGPEAYASQWLQGTQADAGVQDETVQMERCLLHVAATRAKKSLWVFQRNT